VEQINHGNWLDPQEAEALRDEQRAVHAYMTMLPALNVIRMRDGSGAGVRRRLSCPADLEGPDGQPRLGADAERRRDLLDELSRPEGDRPAHGRRAAERDRHVHRLLPADDHERRRDRPGPGARRALPAVAAQL